MKKIFIIVLTALTCSLNIQGMPQGRRALQTLTPLQVSRINNKRKSPTTPTRELKHSPRPQRKKFDLSRKTRNNR